MTSQSSQSLSFTTGVVTIVITLAGWSSVPLFIKHFSTAIDLWTSNGWRYGFSAFLWAPVVIAGLLRNRLPDGIWKAAVPAAIVNCIGQVAFTWSFYKIDPATATFGLRSQMVFVVLGAWFLLPAERPILRHRGTWVGIVLILTGVVGTSLAKGQVPNPSETFGMLLAVGAGACFGLYGICVRKFLHGFHPIVAFSVISQYTAFVMVVLMLLLARPIDTSGVPTGGPDFGAGALALPATQFVLLLVSAIAGIALGHVFFYISLARLGIATTSGVIQLQPFCVAIGGYFLLEQPLTWQMLAWGGVAVAGALLMLVIQHRVTHRLKRERTGDTESLIIPEQDECTMLDGDLEALPAEVRADAERP